jgi:predicted nucleic acid-binding Zn ribbon protein
MDEASGLVCRKEETMNIFYIIGVVVVVLLVLGYLGLR